MSEDVLENLLDAVEKALDSWSFYPSDEFGTPESLIDTDTIVDLQQKYEDYCKYHNINV